MKTTAPTTLAAAEAKVATLISAQLESKALRALEACLDAEVYVRGGRSTEGGIDYRSAPDHAVRLAAATKILEFSRGKPASSLVVTNVPLNGQRPDSPRDLAATVAKYPELARQVMDQYIAAARVVSPAVSDEPSKKPAG